MRVDRKLGSLVVFLIIALSAGCVSRTTAPEPVPFEWPSQPTREQIEQAEKLIVRVFFLGPGVWAAEPRDYHATGPEALAVIRDWIWNHAWPPIPPNRVGAVRPLGIISVFETAEADSVDFPIYQATIRGPVEKHAPIAVHVTCDAWQELVSFLEP